MADVEINPPRGVRRQVLFDETSRVRVEDLVFPAPTPYTLKVWSEGYMRSFNEQVITLPETHTLVFHRPIVDSTEIRLGETLAHHEDGSMCATEATALGSVPVNDKALLKEVRERLAVFLA